MAIDDAIGQILWTRHFLAAEVMVAPTTTIYKDYKSTILLSENGITSSSSQTKHFNIRYFSVTEKIKKIYGSYCFPPRPISCFPGFSVKMVFSSALIVLKNF